MELEIPCNPVPWHRPQFQRSGRTYTHKDDRAFAEELGTRLMLIVARHKVFPIKHEIRVGFLLWRRHVRHQQRGDLSNMVKNIEDVGNKVLWWDDRLIRAYGEVDIVDHGDVEGKIIITIEDYVPRGVLL